MRMTRINCVPPWLLTDEHLLAEWRELPRVYNYINGKPSPVDTYRMGKGHVLFFRDKTGWLSERHKNLTLELEKRGFNLNVPSHNKVVTIDGLDEPWEPGASDYAVNLERLQSNLDNQKRPAKFFRIDLHRPDTHYKRWVGWNGFKRLRDAAIAEGFVCI